jgi:heme-degrading monooxygenase HmoA
LVDVSIVKHNRARSKPDVIEENKRVLIGFFNSLQGKVKGLKGYLILDGVKDAQEILVLTFWETRQDMEIFCTPANKVLADFAEKTKSLLEMPPERTDYTVVKFKM